MNCNLNLLTHHYYGGNYEQKNNIKLLLTFFAIFTFSVMWLARVAGAENGVHDQHLNWCWQYAYDGQELWWSIARLLSMDLTLQQSGQVVNNAVVTHQRRRHKVFVCCLRGEYLIVDATSKMTYPGAGMLQGRTLGNTTVGAATLVAADRTVGLGGFGWNGSTTNAVYGDYQKSQRAGFRRRSLT